jgi:hypothetical protein
MVAPKEEIFSCVRTVKTVWQAHSKQEQWYPKAKKHLCLRSSWQHSHQGQDRARAA